MIFKRRPMTALAVGAGLIVAGTLAVQAQPAAITHVAPTGSYVSLGASIWVRFAEAMDSSSVESALVMQPAVPGRFVWSEDDRQVEYRPDEPLAPLTTHEVRLGTIMRNARGEPVLERPYVWSFKTTDRIEQMRFSYIVPVQLLTPGGGRGVPVQPGFPRMTVDCALYDVDMPDFARRYSAIEPYRAYQIDVSGLRTAKQWQARIDASEAVAEIDIPDDVPPGLYALEAKHALAGSAQTFLIYSDYALVAKRGRSEVHAWVAEVPDGAPVAGAVVTAYDTLGTELASAVTTADGAVRFAGIGDVAFATAFVAGQTTLVGVDNYWCSDYQNCGGYWRGRDWISEPPELAAHIHTDRPIYRPGHTVYYKASLRRIELDGYSVVAASVPLTATVKDAGGNTVSTASQTADEFGSLAGEVRLGDDVALGDWRIEVDTGRQTFTGYFQVQEYVKPDYEVKVSTDRPFYIRGDTAEVTVQGDYYFGQPAAGAEVTLRVFRGSYRYYNRSGNQVGEHQGVLDAEGTWSVRVSLPTYTTYAETYYFEAEVVDASRRPVVSEAAVPVHPAEFSLWIRNPRYGVEKGQPVELIVGTIGHDGEPAVGRKVDVTVLRYYRYGDQSYRQETVTTGDDGTARLLVENVEAGWYRVTATTHDDRGNRLEARSYAWVFDRARPWYWYGGLEVTADKDSYAPGDVAHLLIRSPVTSTALITLERDDVYDEIVVPVSGATTVDIPVKAEYAPGVQAKIHLWQPQDYANVRAEARLLTGWVALSVPATDKRLNVAITPDAETHAPGEQAAFTVSVTDADGQPVRAQLSFALVDKAVLALAADRSGDIYDAFWSTRGSSVSTFDSLRPSQWSAYDERDYSGQPRPAPTSAASPTGTPAAGQEDQEEASQATPRREFPDTAYWKADLVTGGDGKVTMTLKLPDNLTTWKALARAITVDTKAGQGSGELVVTKPIMADPALPRFAVQGDEFALDVLARNYAGGTLDAEISLDTPGLHQIDKGDKQLVLPFNETRFARWTVVASELGENPVTAQVTTAAGGDAIELPLEVAPFSAPDRFVRSGSTTGTVSESFSVPYNAIPAMSKVEVNLTPGVAIGILDGVEDLIGYPYGCIEQTMSRMMPNAVVNRLVQELDIEAPEIARQLPDMMALGLQKIYRYQHEDGSWGYWSGGKNVYITAYVLQGLTMLQQGGYDVDQAVMERGFTWLQANNRLESDIRIRAYAPYVLAINGRADATEVQELYDRRAELDTFGLAALAIALDEIGRASLAAVVLDELEAMAVETAATASWPLAVRDRWHWDFYHWRTMAATDKHTAMALEALAQLRPESPLAPKAARWLMENRRGYGGFSRGWSSTQATSFAVLALTDYIVASGELWAEYDWSVSFDGQTVAMGTVDATTIKQRIPPIAVTGTAMAPGDHTLTLTKQGDGTLFYTVIGRLALYYDGFEPTAAEGYGLEVTREYTPIAGRSGPGGWTVGDVVNVRVTIDTTDALHYLIIEDPLPAGLEGLNESLETESSRVPSQPPNQWWRWRGYERKEVRDDKVNFFVTYLEPGTHTFDYAARAVTPGVFSSRPAEVYAMYRPDVWGRSASDQVVVDRRQIEARPLLAGDFDRDCRLTAFDASLVAAQWPDGGTRDVNTDGRLDVADIATAAGRRGLSCGDGVPLPPGIAGDMSVQLRAPDRIEAGHAFELEVVLMGEGNVGGYDLTLELPENAFEVLGASSGDELAGAYQLNPIVRANTVRFGAYALTGATVSGELTLARLRLRATRTGDADIRITRAQIVTDRGGEYTVTAEGTTVSPIPWAPRGRLYLPFSLRSATIR